MLHARPDGTPVRSLHPLRRFMPFIMPTRNGAFVLFEQTIEARPARRLIERLNAARPPGRPVTFFHLVLRALTFALHEYPNLNRYVAGGRLYQREGVWISVSLKERLDIGAPLLVRKLRFDPTEPLVEAVDRFHATLQTARGGEETVSDREIAWLLRLPLPLLRVATRVLRWLDAWNLVPARVVREDPMNASAFVANLGSIGLDAAYHHLYEHGTIPIFVTVGRVHHAPVALADGSVVSQEVFVLRYTYDERVEDGLYCARALERVRALLESPEALVA